MIYHAWYSKEAELSLNRSGRGASVYRTLDGGEIKITEVSKSETTTSRWPDQTYLGLVDKWLRYADPIISVSEFHAYKAAREEQERIIKKGMYQ